MGWGGGKDVLHPAGPRLAQPQPECLGCQDPPRSEAASVWGWRA